MSDKVAVSEEHRQAADNFCHGTGQRFEYCIARELALLLAQREAAAYAAGFQRAIADAQVILDDYAGHWKECPAPTGCDCGYTNEVRKFREARDRALAAKPPRETGGET